MATYCVHMHMILVVDAESETDATLEACCEACMLDFVSMVVDKVELLEGDNGGCTDRNES